MDLLFFIFKYIDVSPYLHFGRNGVSEYRRIAYRYPYPCNIAYLCLIIRMLAIICTLTISCEVPFRIKNYNSCCVILLFVSISIFISIVVLWICFYCYYFKYSMLDLPWLFWLSYRITLNYVAGWWTRSLILQFF